MDSKRSAPPGLQWSHTRDEIFRACARRYFYQYFLAHGGWRPGAPAAVRRAYALSRLQTLDLVLGTAIHARAREIARAITGGHERPPLDKLRERTRAELNAVCLRSRDLGAFLRDPKSHPVLQSAYYGFGVSRHTAARVRAKMERCLASLVTSSVWDDLATCPRAAVRIIDAPALFDTDATSVWVVPDLIYTPPSGRTTIVDWKTGNADGAAVHQLSLYAWFVRDVLALPMGPAGYEGRVVELGSGTEWYVDLTDEAITEARERLGTSVDAMQALLEAPCQRRIRMSPFWRSKCRSG